MQVGNKDVLNCYYAHAEDSLQVLPASTHSVIRRPLLVHSACDMPFLDACFAPPCPRMVVSPAHNQWISVELLSTSR